MISTIEVLGPYFTGRGFNSLNQC